MAQFTKEQFLNAYSRTPKNVQGILFSDETRKALDRMCARYGVNNKLFRVSANTGYVLVGLVPVKRFIQALQEDAGLDEKTAKNVAHDVRNDIFASIAKELFEIQEEAEIEWAKAHSGEDAKNPPMPSGAQQAGKMPETNSQQKENSADTAEMQSTASNKPDESVVREVFPTPEVNEKKFDNNAEKPEKKEGDKDERF